MTKPKPGRPGRPKRPEKIPCPTCGSFDGKVVDSRPSAEFDESCIRRRDCANGHRFSTVEIERSEYLRLRSVEETLNKAIAAISSTKQFKEMAK